MESENAAAKEGPGAPRSKSDRLRLVFKDPVQKANAFATTPLVPQASPEGATPAPRTPSPDSQRPAAEPYLSGQSSGEASDANGSQSPSDLLGAATPEKKEQNGKRKTENGVAGSGREAEAEDVPAEAEWERNGESMGEPGMNSGSGKGGGRRGGAEGPHAAAGGEGRAGDRLARGGEGRGRQRWEGQGVGGLAGVARALFVAAAVLILVAAVTLGAFCFMCGDERVQDFMRERDFHPVFQMLEQGSVLRIAGIEILKRLATDSRVNKEALVELGLVPMLVTMLRTHSGWQPELQHKVAARMLHFLCKGVPKHADALLASGGVPALVELVQEGPEAEKAATAAETLAVLMANQDSVYAESVVAADGVEALINLLEGADSPVSTSAAWALANLAGTNTTAQDAIRMTDGLEHLVRLVGAGSEAVTSHAAILALGNLVVHNSRNQEAVYEAMGVDAAVTLLESSIDTTAEDHVDAGIKRQLIEQVFEASKESDVVKSAIRKVGGADQLIRLVLPEAAGKLSFWDPDRHAVAKVIEGPNGTDKDTAKHIMELLAMLQADQGHVRFGGSSFMSVFKRHNDPIKVHIRLAEEAAPLSREHLADRAAWAIGNIAAGDARCQDAVRKAGGIELLVTMLETASASPIGAKSAASALTLLIRNNKENLNAVLRTNAVQMLLRILGTNSDKEVVDSAAHVLKVMAHEGLFDGDAKVTAIGEWITRQLQAVGLEIDPQMALLFGAAGPVVWLAMAIVRKTYMHRG
ncbi:unnamed protein product [Ostreobium quekettii]|uniref:Uncharacterized protein n=1 Tax=Ostreobium quekettii TaxID=121088 RepID=A0A8S1J3V4_9CHLO|nr:unnamed protein product [Ostreobium quekettii]|eukprot:evm.model.scf_27.7 EVM.evm.TU.scf_27.7   scf_27:51239-59371(+)